MSEQPTLLGVVLTLIVLFAAVTASATIATLAADYWLP